MTGLPNPWVALGLTLAFVASTTGAFFYGKKVGVDAVKADLLEVIEQQMADKQVLQDKIDEQARQAQQREFTRQVQQREIYVEVPRVILANPTVYSGVCIDPDGVRLIDRATAVNSEPAGEPTGAPGANPDGPPDDTG